MFRKRLCLLFLGVLLAGRPVWADGASPGRVIVIGIDGLRSDSLQAAKTPAIDSMVRTGCISESTRILGDRYRENDTVSGPGWSSFLTGVWADKHGVDNNRFRITRYDEFPHFFARIKQVNQDLVTASLVDWEPIDQHIVRDADHRYVFPAHGAEEYARMDSKVATKATEILRTNDPHAMMVYFGSVDETGHRHGFHPSVPEYIQAIENVDQKIQHLLDAVRSRPNHKDENWLYVISTDHGGRGTGHGGGHEVAEINTTFLIVSGQAAKRGTLAEPTYVVDVPVIALTHLGIEIDPKWRLDGRAVGLRNTKANPARTLDSIRTQPLAD